MRSDLNNIDNVDTVDNVDSVGSVDKVGTAMRQPEAISEIR